MSAQVAATGMTAAGAAAAGSGAMRRPLPVLAAAIITCGALTYGMMRLATPLGQALATWSAAGLETLFTLILFGLLAVIGGIGRRLAAIDERLAGRRVAAGIGLGLAIGLGGFLATLAYADLAGAVMRGQGTTELRLPLLLLGSIVVIGQSAAEELFFRGWLQPVLMRAWGAVPAIGLTSLVFAGLHVAGGARGPLELLNLALGGILFGLLAWRSGGIAAPIAAHAGWNWAEGILFGLDPNPGIGSFGAIHDLDLAGSPLWGGSASGLNASVAMTLVLVAVIVPLTRSTPTRSGLP